MTDGSDPPISNLYGGLIISQIAMVWPIPYICKTNQTQIWGGLQSKVTRKKKLLNDLDMIMNQLMQKCNINKIQSSCPSIE